MVLAIVLGDKAEEAFRQSLLASQGGLGVFFSNGLVEHDHGARPDRAVLADHPEPADPPARHARAARRPNRDLRTRHAATGVARVAGSWNIVYQS